MFVIYRLKITTRVLRNPVSQTGVQKEARVLQQAEKIFVYGQSENRRDRDTDDTVLD